MSAARVRRPRSVAGSGEAARCAVLPRVAQGAPAPSPVVVRPGRLGRRPVVLGHRATRLPGRTNLGRHPASARVGTTNLAGRVTTIVYTDGACRGNPGPGGWAWVVPDGPYEAGYEDPSTNQRMEIKAAAQAVATLAGPVEVRSDSIYVVNCFVKRWWEGWERRQWKNAQGKPVANRDLWEPFIEAVKARCAAGEEIRFSWVKGHAGDHWNETADRLAVTALRERRPLSGRSGDELVLGEVDPGPLGGHGVVVLGHGPPGLAGAEDDVRRRLTDHLRWRGRDIDDLVVATGLRRGTEQLGAEAAAGAGIPYVAVLPFPEPDRSWPPEQRDRFAELQAGARRTLVLETEAPADAREVTAALRRRDAWLTEHAREALLVWDGRDPELAKLYRSLVEGLGEGAGDEVWTVAPRPGDGAPGAGRRVGSVSGAAQDRLVEAAAGCGIRLDDEDVARLAAFVARVEVGVTQPAAEIEDGGSGVSAPPPAAESGAGPAIGAGPRRRLGLGVAGRRRRLGGSGLAGPRPRRAARRLEVGGQGPHRSGRAAASLRFGRHLRRPARGRGRPGGGRPAGGGGPPGGHDPAARVRLRDHRGRPGVRHAGQPVGSRPGARRVVVGRSGGRGPGRGRPVPGHRHRRLGPHPGRPLRGGRTEAQLRRPQHRRRRPVGALARPRRPAGGVVGPSAGPRPGAGPPRRGGTAGPPAPAPGRGRRGRRAERPRGGRGVQRGAGPGPSRRLGAGRGRLARRRGGLRRHHRRHVRRGGVRPSPATGRPPPALRPRRAGPAGPGAGPPGHHLPGGP